MGDKSARELILEEVMKEYNIWNDDLVIKNNQQELADQVIKVLIRHHPTHYIKLLHTELRVSTEEERCRAVLKDVYAKKYEKGATITEFYVNALQEKLYTLDIQLVLSAEFFNAAYRNSLMYNTRNKLLMMKGQGMDIDLENFKDIISFDIPQHTLHDDDPDLNDNLLYNIRIMIPYNKYGYYMLSDRRYYNGYFKMADHKFTANGKLIVESAYTTSYVHDVDGILMHQVISNNYNIYNYLYGEVSIDDAIDYLMQQDVAPDDLVHFRASCERYVYDPDDKPASNLVDDLNAVKILDIIAQYYKERNMPKIDINSINPHGTVLSKYESLRKGDKTLNTELRKYIPSIKVAEGKKKHVRLAKPSGMRSKINPHQLMLVTLIKTRSQFPSYDKTNEADGFFLLSYVKSHSSGKFAQEKSRKFVLNEVGVVDPISTPGSKNVGMAGNIVTTIPMEIIKL